MNQAAPSIADREAPGSLRALLVEQGPTLAGSLAAGLLATVGLYRLARRHGLGPASGLLAALAGACLWVALSAGPLAAAGPGPLRSLLRGGAQADACGLGLAIVWLLARRADPPLAVTWSSLLACYAVLVSMALLAVAAVCCAKGWTGRLCLAALATTALVALCATPFWTAGLVEHAQAGQTDRIARLAVEWNPFYAVTAAVIEPVGFIWHQDGPLMYQRIARIGPDVPAPPLRWWPGPLRLSAAAGCLGLVALVRTKLRRRRRGPSASGGPAD